MKKTTTLIAVAAAAVLLPGLLAACSGAPSGNSSDKASGGGKKNDVALSSCMRDKGYDMPDPDSGGKKQALSAPDGVDQEQWTGDLETCLGDTGAGDDLQTSSVFGTPEQAKKIAVCIRASGFADYPDDAEAASTYDPTDDGAFRDASRKCVDKVLGASGGAGAAD